MIHRLALQQCIHRLSHHPGISFTGGLTVSDHWQSTCLLKACRDVRHYIRIVRQLLTFQLTICIPKLHHALMQGQSYSPVLQRGVVIQVLYGQNSFSHSWSRSISTNGASTSCMKVGWPWAAAMSDNCQTMSDEGALEPCSHELVLAYAMLRKNEVLHSS